MSSQRQDFPTLPIFSPQLQVPVQLRLQLQHRFPSASIDNETMATAFPLFPCLPTELRLKIWHLSALQPRVLDFSAKVPRDDRLGQQEYLRALKRREFNTRALGTGIRSDIRWLTSVPPPAMLSVCAESREVALVVYTLAFDLSGWYEEGTDWTAYINPALDTVYCNTYSSLLVHYLLSDLQACDGHGSGALLLALNEKCFAESLVCRPPEGLRGSRYLEELELMVLVTDQDGEVGDKGRGQWRLVEGTMPLEQQMSFQYRMRKRPLDFFHFAMRNVDVGKRPEFKFCALRREVTE